MMTSEEEYNLLKQKSNGLFPSLIYISTHKHFLDTNPFIPFIENEDLEGLSLNEKEIITKYIEDYLKYKKERNKYLEFLNTDEGIEKLKNDETLMAGFLEISNIIKEDFFSKYTKSLNGQRILLSIINSKNLYEILSKIFHKEFAKTKKSFELKMFSFEEQYKEKRLKQLHLNTIIDNEVQILNDEFKKFGGLQFIEKIKINFEGFFLDISEFDDSLSTISGNFERDFDFFSNKPQSPYEYLNANDINEYLKDKDNDFEKKWRLFVSKHLKKIFYVVELKNHIENIKNFQGEPFIEEATEYTLKRQIIAILLLLKEAGIDFNSLNNKEIAHFIRFVTKIGLTQKKIEKTTIYKNLSMVDILNENDDLTFVKNQLSNLNLTNFLKN
jgi:hypothetical protein